MMNKKWQHFIRNALVTLSVASIWPAQSSAPIWESQHPGAGGQHQCVVTDPSVDGRVYICIDMNGIFRSDDSGDSWKNYYTDAASGFAFHLAIDPTDSDIIYSGNFWGVDISHNGGENWTSANLPVPESLDSGGGDAIAWLTIDPNNSQNIFAAPSWRVKDNEKRNKDIIWPLQPHAGIRNIYVSSDAGASWQSEVYEATDGYRQIYSTAVHPTSSELYIGAHSGIYRRNGANDYTRLPVPAGAIDGLNSVTRKDSGNRGVSFSPDGEWLYALWAIEMFTDDHGKTQVETQLYAYNLTSQQWTQLSADGLRPAEYALPQVDPRSSANEHKILLPNAYDGPTSDQKADGNVGRTGLWEYTVNVTGNLVSDSEVALIGEKDGVGDFQYEAGWEHREWKLRGATYTSEKWNTRSIFASGGQQMYRANTEEAGFPYTAWTDIYSKKVEGGRYTNRGYAATVNFDATAYGDYAVQNLADLGVFDSFDGGKSWEEIVVYAQSSHSSQIVSAEGETPLSIIHLNRGYGNTAGNKGGLYFKRLNHDLSASVYTQLAGVNMKYIQVTGTGQIRLRGLPNLVYKDQAYDPTTRSLYIGTRSGPNAGIYRALDIFEMANETEETEEKYKNFFRISGENDDLIANETINRLFVDPNNHNQLWIQLHDSSIVSAINSDGWSFEQKLLVDEFDNASTSSEINAAKDMYVWDNNGQTYIAVVRGNDLLVSPNAGQSFHYITSADDLFPGVNPGWLDGPGTLDLARWVAGYENKLFFGLSNYTHRRNGGFYEIELKAGGKEAAQTTNITGDPKSEGYWARSTRANVVDNVTEEGAFLLVPTRGSGLLRYKIGTGNTPAPEIDLTIDDSTINVADTIKLGTVLQGTSKNLAFNISNNGNNTLQLSGSPLVRLNGEQADNFNVVTEPAASIEVGENSDFAIEFTPTVTGANAVSVSIENNDISESEFDFNLSATVLEPFGFEAVNQVIFDQRVAMTGFNGEDLGANNTGLRLIPMGYLTNANGQTIRTVWKIRNSSETARTVTLNDEFNVKPTQTFTIPAGFELYAISQAKIGDATHILSEAGTIIDTQSTIDQLFVDETLVAVVSGRDVSAPIDGSSELKVDEFKIAGSGRGFTLRSDQAHMVAQTLLGDTSIFGSIDSVPASGEFGLMFRTSYAGKSQAVFVGVQGDGTLVFARRVTEQEPMEVLNTVNISAPVYLKLERNANFFTASYSLDGINYIEIGTTLVLMPFEVLGGYSAASLSATETAEVVFKNIGLVTQPNNVAAPDARLVQENDLVVEADGVIDMGVVAAEVGSETMNLFIDNIGTDTLLLSGDPIIEITGSEAFSLANLPSNNEIGIGESVSFQLNFDPQARGSLISTLSFANNDPDENPYSVTVMGFAQRPVPENGIYSSEGFESGDLAGGTDWNDDQWDFTIDNERFIPEVLDSNGPASGDFHVRIPRSSSLTRTVDVSGGENLLLNFKWKGESLDPDTNDGGVVQINSGDGYVTVFEINGDQDMSNYRDEVIDLSAFDFERAGSVELRFMGSNNGGSEYLFFDDISITVAGADIAVALEQANLSSGATFDMGAAEANVENISKTVSITSTGNLALNFVGSPSIRIEGDDASEFAIVGDISAGSLEPGAVLEFMLEFIPTSSGTKSAVLVIVSNDKDLARFELNLSAIGFIAGATLDAMDDFESSGFAGGEGWLDDQWTTTVDNTRFFVTVETSNSPQEGSHHVRIPRSASMERRVNTLDATNPLLSFWWKAANWNDKGNDGLIVEVYDGEQWTSVFEAYLADFSSEYQQASVNLSEFAVNPAADLVVRFKGNNNGGNEVAFIDAISLIDDAGQQSLQGDWDADGDVDMDDVRALVGAIQQRLEIDMAFDLNGDGLVNILDSRHMMTLCSRASCAV